MYKLTGGCQLRAPREDDQAFLDVLYASRRLDLQQLPVDPVVVAQMIKMQQHVQMAGIRQHFPDAQHWIVEQTGQPVGRVIIDAGTNDMRLVDIAIAPEAQRQGIARSVLLAMQEEATEQNQVVSLAVELSNHAAKALYLQMGFLVQSTDGLFEQMHWHGRAGVVDVRGVLDVGNVGGIQMEQRDVTA
ncbi:GNAT family N-acetyltransferase [Undibacterium sp. Ji49W]|uniref:GNAT family N-acetyltransferase n=1 Tax=Undibacterium sp. Ji49W TaxID=3413040 RepID=UPI003BF4830C